MVNGLRTFTGKSSAWHQSYALWNNKKKRQFGFTADPQLCVIIVVEKQRLPIAKTELLFHAEWKLHGPTDCKALIQGTWVDLSAPLSIPPIASEP